jgi:hypothetical protein
VLISPNKSTPSSCVMLAACPHSAISYLLTDRTWDVYHQNYYIWALRKKKQAYIHSSKITNLFPLLWAVLSFTLMILQSAQAICTTNACCIMRSWGFINKPDRGDHLLQFTILKTKTCCCWWSPEPTHRKHLNH